MPVEMVVPSFGESVSEVVIARWLKNEGDVVRVDESLAELESDKATVELPAPSAGRISQLLKQPGDNARVGEVIGYIDETAQHGQATKQVDASASATPAAPAVTENSASSTGQEPARPAPVQQPQPAATTTQTQTRTQPPPSQSNGAGQDLPKAAPRLMPSAERLMAERGLTPADMVGLGSGPGGRVLKEDVQRAGSTPAPAAPAQGQPRQAQAASLPAQDHHQDIHALEEILPMSPIRKRIAARLVQSKQEMAILTTFNEIDMSAVMALRKQYQEQFQQKYSVKLGFMSFFVKATIEALKQFPQVNGEIRGTDIVYKNYYDIGIAVGGGKGLVVPVLRSADRLSFAECELAIADYGKRAMENKLAIEEFTGGTFTISNGGVYGSLMSTPIVNPPQSAILGLHAIQERAVVREGQIVARPMMYVAVSYDHRLIDGRESVTFLRRIKDCIEDPTRILLEV
jgi:2-oxoglutarate dehydrogenase E2 component (dihydrolipoamide succinyltransferase)